MHHIYKDQPCNRIVRYKKGYTCLNIYQVKGKFKGKLILVCRSAIDDQYTELVSRYKWSFNGKYIMTSKKPTILLHRLILLGENLCNSKELLHLDVHHRNCNPLNNRRRNLEILTKSCHTQAHLP